MTSTDETSHTDRNEQPAQRSNLSYDDVDISVTSGYKPMIVIAALTIITFFLFGGGLPIYWGDSQGYTLFTYGSVLWGLTIISLGFIYEFWVERNETANETEQVTEVRRNTEGE